MVCFKNNYKYILSFFINFTIFANVINANVLVFFSFYEANGLVSFSNPFSRFSFQSVIARNVAISSKIRNAMTGFPLQSGLNDKSYTVCKLLVFEMLATNSSKRHEESCGPGLASG